MRRGYDEYRKWKWLFLVIPCRDIWRPCYLQYKSLFAQLCILKMMKRKDLKQQKMGKEEQEWKKIYICDQYFEINPNY